MNTNPHRRRLTQRLLTGKYESLDFRIRCGLFLVDLAAGLFFSPLHLWWRWRRRYDPKDIKKILIFRMDGLGDLVLSTPALREIRKGFPEAQITLVIGPWSQAVIPCMPFYDRLIIHDAFAFGYFRGRRSLSLKNEWTVLKKLRRERFDLGIDLRGDILSIIPLFLSGARFRFGRDRWGGGFLLTHAVSTDRSKRMHEKDKTLSLLHALRIPIEDEALALRIPEEADASVKRFLHEHRISGRERIVAMAPAALYPLREWPAEKYAELAERLIAAYQCRIILIGGPENSRKLDDISAWTQGRAINGAGRLELCGTAALIRRSSLFIGNDSGLNHVAAAVGTPLVQLFGPGEPEKFGYAGRNQVVVMKTDCPDHPCQQRKCRDPEHRCMDRISVEDVFAACRILLDGRAAGMPDGCDTKMNRSGKDLPKTAGSNGKRRSS